MIILMIVRVVTPPPPHSGLSFGLGVEPLEALMNIWTKHAARRREEFVCGVVGSSMLRHRHHCTGGNMKEVGS